MSEMTEEKCPDSEDVLRKRIEKWREVCSCTNEETQGVLSSMYNKIYVEDKELLDKINNNSRKQGGDCKCRPKTVVNTKK